MISWYLETTKEKSFMWMLECEFEDLVLVSVKNETKSTWHSMLLVIFFFIYSKLQYSEIQRTIPYCFPTVTYASTDR